MNTVTRSTEFDHLAVPAEYLKMCKKNRVFPAYEQYRSIAITKGEPVISEKMYNFVRSTVYEQRPIAMGIKHKIYRQNGDIVDATFLRQFVNFRVWQLDDTLIATDLMNTELASSTYQQIFHFVLER